METIQGNMAKATAPQAIGATAAADSATSQATQLGQASTGKAAGASGAPRATNLAAQVSAGQANLGAQQLSQQAAVQGEQLKTQEAGIAQQQKLQNRELDEQALTQHDAYANKATQILGELTRGTQQLDTNKQKTQLEHLGQAARLSNDQYTHQLATEGERARLDDASVFQEQMQNAIFADQKDLLEHDVDFKIAINGKQNQWQEYLGEISLDHALDMSNAKISAANQQMMWSAGNQIFDTATSAFTGGMMKGAGGASGGATPGRADAGPAQYQQESFAPGQNGNQLESLNPEPAPSAASRYGAPNGIQS
jgi:hypothetical protein